MNETGRVLIKDATLFDGTGASLRERTSVLIEDGRIAAVAPSAELAEAPGARVVEAAGKWLIPGLIDMHVHVMLSGGEDALYGWLGTGITSIRDVGGAPEVLLPLREAVASGEKTGPRIFSYGPMLDGSPSIFGGRNQAMLPGAGALTWTLEDEDDVARACDDLLGRGVDGFKLYAGLRPDLLGAFIKRVDGRVPVTGHLSRTWASEAADAGINCLEHVHATIYQDIARPEHRHPREEGNGFIPNYWTWLNTGWAAADSESDYVRAFVEKLVAKDVALSPTTVLITGGMATREALEEPGLKYMPRGMAERRRQQAENMQRMREEAERAGRPLPPLQATPTPETVEAGRKARENELRFLLMVYEAGGTLVPSTDCGAAPNQVPGFSLHRELGLFSEAGIPNEKVLQMATSVAARVLRRDAEIGTITPGKRADLLVLGGDPVAEINNTRKVEVVVKDGAVYEPQPLLDRAAAGA